MTEFQLIMMMVALLDALAVVLHVWHRRLVDDWHAAAFYNPLASPGGRAVRRHLRGRRCADCSMVVDLVLTRTV